MSKKKERTTGISNYIEDHIVGLAVAGVILLVAVITLFNQASLRRGLKSMTSEFNNGIDRTITVYDYNGKELRTWSGKFDVTESETGIMFDDQNGKRTIITGGIVINEED